MAAQRIRFDDGAAYERMMGGWSQIAGTIFLDWLALPAGLRWLDVGCGNGAFTELLVERCAPATVQGIDPSEGQLAFARTRSAACVAQFRQGDAMALPFPDDAFDVAVMASSDVELLKARLRACLLADATGRITYNGAQLTGNSVRSCVAPTVPSS